MKPIFCLENGLRGGRVTERCRIRTPGHMVVRIVVDRRALAGEGPYHRRQLQDEQAEVWARPNQTPRLPPLPLGPFASGVFALFSRSSLRQRARRSGSITPLETAS